MKPSHLYPFLTPLFLFIFLFSEEALAHDMPLPLLKSRCLIASDTLSCAKAAVILEKRGEKKAARRLYKKACLAPLRPLKSACYFWGFLSDTPRQALHPYLRACRLGDSDGCTAAAEIFAKRRQFGKALPLYKKGCRLGDGRSCHRLAKWHFRHKQPRQALLLLKRSCQLKYPAGCGYLGWYWEMKKHDTNRAEKLYKKGCSLKSSVECARLGLLYAKQQRFKKGLRFLRRSCRLGFRKGCSLADRLTQNLRRGRHLFEH